MIFDFFVIVDFVWSGLRKKIKDLVCCCGLLVVGLVDVCTVLVFFLVGCFYYYFNVLFVLF